MVDRNVKDFERRRSQEFLEESVEAPPKPERFITRQSVHSKEIEDLSVNQLEVSFCFIIKKYNAVVILLHLLKEFNNT